MSNDNRSDHQLARRRFLASGLAVVCGLRTVSSAGAVQRATSSVAERKVGSAWKWKLLSPNGNQNAGAYPVARDPWNGMAEYFFDIDFISHREKSFCRAARHRVQPSIHI